MPGFFMERYRICLVWQTVLGTRSKMRVFGVLRGCKDQTISIYYEIVSQYLHMMGGGRFAGGGLGA